MKGRIVFVLGGSRSGKSKYAESLAGSISEPKTYLATSPVIDQEMQSRIRKHIQTRQGRGWTTIEEQLDLDRVITDTQGTILVDCITLWINNLMYHAEVANQAFAEEEMEILALQLMKTCKSREGLTILVSNEVGQGIVPDNKAARLFRDLTGIANQVIAKESDEVYFVVSGIAQKLK